MLGARHGELHFAAGERLEHAQDVVVERSAEATATELRLAGRA
jgi:hypothetical protein